MKSISAILLLATLLLGGCGEQTKQTTDQNTAKKVEISILENYKHGAKELVQMIKQGQPDSEIAKKSAELVANSKSIIKEFIVKHPKCTTYLNALNEAADLIPTLPLAEIESGYHEDGKLPKFDDPNCYHAKDLLVHPATVQAMANMGISSNEMRESAEHEIIEVIAHFSQVEKVLN